MMLTTMMFVCVCALLQAAAGACI